MRFLLIAGMLVVLASCATQRAQRELQPVLDGYAAALRWGDFQSALAFLDPDWREAHPLSDLDRARYRQVRVSEYDVKSQQAVSDYEIRQVAEIGLVNVHTQTERHIFDRQTWRYDQATRHWWLVSGLPDISHPQ